jgi:signal transduction histidine kinase
MEAVGTSSLHESGTYPIAHLELAHEALRSLPVALLVVRDDGVTLLANRRACAVLEREPADVEGALVESYLAPLDRLLYPSAQDERSARIRVALPSGRTASMGFSTSPIESARGEATHAIILKDITEIARVREERDRLLQIATVHEILPSILHEVKNPLAAIAAAAELLVEEAVEPGVRASAHAILNEARRMKLTLQGIGVVGRALRGARHAAIDHAIRNTCTILRGKADLHGVELSHAVSDLPLLLLDPGVTSGIVLNLLNNAIQATERGGAVRLAASLGEGGRDLVLSVADDGAGMTPEVLSRCREIFFTTKPRGTGIGLALCERAVTEAGGRIDIESAPGRGTTITLRVPIAPGRA